MESDDDFFDSLAADDNHDVVSDVLMGFDGPGEDSDQNDFSRSSSSPARNETPVQTIIESNPRTRIEVAIPEMPREKRDEYLSVRSEIIEFILGELDVHRGKARYHVEFTEGRQEVLSLADLVTLDNGRAALSRFNQGIAQGAGEMPLLTQKRKRDPEDEWDSDNSGASDLMDLDEDELANDGHETDRPLRTLNVQSSRASRIHSSLIISDDDDDLSDLKGVHSAPPTRVLRTRTQRQVKLTSMNFKNGLASQEPDELVDDEPRHISTDEDDGDFALVTSDLPGAKKGRPTKARLRSKRLQAMTARQKARSGTSSRQKSPDSDIEFEAPRRSARSTRNKASMRDDALMDDDSFYVVDDKGPGAPKVISVREVFQPVPPDSSFASMHMDTCHTCHGSKSKGLMVHCQGCTLSYHKNCLGFRSAREHLVTKVGEDDFVLQCRYCIGISQKKDSRAPDHSMCQDCKGHGRTCAAFSERKTARQEEKLREQNDGVDPVTEVSEELLNDSDLVLFRCITCHRGWHVEHLPGSDNSIHTDLKSERLKDYSVDWQCDECASAKHKIHRLVAWRPKKHGSFDEQLTYAEVAEDDKEYLVKWETTSYAHCTWMPGAWIFGVAASTMRTAFGKRDLEQGLLRYTAKDAIPDEFIMPDVILNSKMDSSAPRLGNKEAELASLSHVSKIFVKFQGLGYDDVVWDSPPSPDMGDIYTAFTEAYHEYVEGKYFHHDSQNKMRERIKSFKSAPFIEVDVQPHGLKRGKLMGYQVEGLNWLLENYHHNRSVVLADEMGLGKTVQVVSLVTSLVQDKPRCWPFLIVVPNATCPNWRREFKQWAPDLRVVTYHGGKEPQELAYKYELFPHNSKDMKAHVVVMSYDSAQDPRTRVSFNSVNWTGLVVDEGQRLKNDQNLLYVALRAMKIPFRLLLTGTPLQNNKRELFNLIQFIDESQDAVKLDEEFQVLDKETLPKLHEKIRPYFLRRTKAGVLKFLPPMAQIILPVTMTVIQEKLSKSIMSKNPELIKSMFANSKMNRKERGSLNNILMQLRKCLCHPFIYSEAIEEKHHDPETLHRNLVEASAKLILLEIMLPKLKERGHRVLIFSQFLQQLDIIEDFLAGLGYDFRRLDGQIGSLEKQRRIDAFNAPDSPVFAFLLSTRAGGVGINLATADTVIIMDPDFNPHQDIQALSRAHRIGQKKKVLCFQLMTKDSVEERIMQVGRKKMALDHALIESMDDDDLAGDDLESILKHGAQALFSEDYQKEAIHYDAASVDKLLDRTEIEQTKTNDEGSAETQFSYARVWANERSGFDDALAMEEEQEPVPVNSSVWDRILAEREAEARREAEANREVLGRGGRRRLAINYKTNAIEGLAVGEESDSSDEFAAAESGDDSDDDAAITSGKDAEENAVTSRETGETSHSSTDSRQGGKSRRETNKEQSAATNTNEIAPEVQGQKRRLRQEVTRSAGQGEETQRREIQPIPSMLSNSNSGQTFGGVVSGGQITTPGMVSRPGGQPGAPLPNNLNTSYSSSFEQWKHTNGIPRLSEAQLRMALDGVHHSKSNAATKQQMKTVLLRQLQDLSMQAGSRAP